MRKSHYFVGSENGPRLKGLLPSGVSLTGKDGPLREVMPELVLG